MAPLSVSLVSMQRAKTTLEDFVSSYFMFHGLDASQPTVVFKHLPLLMFVEAYIYQLDQENEDKLGGLVNQAQEDADQNKGVNGTSSNQQQQLNRTDPTHSSGDKKHSNEGLEEVETEVCLPEEIEVCTDMLCRLEGGKRKSADGSLSVEPPHCHHQRVILRLRDSGKLQRVSDGGKKRKVSDIGLQKEQTIVSNVGQTGQAASKLLAPTAFAELSGILQSEKLLTPRIVKELQDGLEFWRLECKLCQALAQGQEVKRAEVERAVALKSFDYRVLNLLLYELEGRPVNEQHFEFLRVSELLVEISDDLFDYEDDVLHNTFNVYRCFLAMYGLMEGQLQLAQWICSIECQYEKLLSALDPSLAERYRQRCRSAAKEGGSKLSSSSPVGNWSLPPPIIDEQAYRDEMKIANS